MRDSDVCPLIYPDVHFHQIYKTFKTEKGSREASVVRFYMVKIEAAHDVMNLL